MMKSPEEFPEENLGGISGGKPRRIFWQKCVRHIGRNVLDTSVEFLKKFLWISVVESMDEFLEEYSPEK